MRKLSGIVAVLALAASGQAWAQNSLSVTSAAALGGTTKGLQINVASGAPSPTNAVFVRSNEANNETHMKILFRISVKDLDAPLSGGGRTFRLLQLGDDASEATPHKILFIQRQSTTGNWRLLGWGRNNAGTYVYLGAYFLTGYHSTGDLQVECEWTRATGPSNGTFTCKKVGTGQIFTASSVDDSTYEGDFVQFGFLDYDNFGNNGSGGELYLDEYESYR